MQNLDNPECTDSKRIIPSRNLTHSPLK